MDETEDELTVPEYVRRKIRAAGFDIDSIEEDPPQPATRPTKRSARGVN
jgi:hypothetical protein